MSSLSEIRQQKHVALNNGIYPIQLEDHETIANVLHACELHAKTSLIHEELSPMTPATHGRIRAIRKNGSLIFIRIQDFTGSIQLIAVKKTIEHFNKVQWSTFSNFDVGDIIEVVGQYCLTIKGEKSLLIEDIGLLSKAIFPLPEKWVGLTNKETIYRQRYLDLLSNEESIQRFKDRSNIIKSIRTWLDGAGFMEVETSILQALNSGANAKPFITHHNAADKNLYLRIAPELNLKRLVVGGMDKVYEIGKSFRNEGVSSRHNPEFTMLEMYSAYDTLDNMMYRIWNIIRNAKDFASKDWKTNLSFERYKQISMPEAVNNAFTKLLQKDILTLTTVEINSELNNLSSTRPVDICRVKEIVNSLSLSAGIKIAELFELIAEPFLTEDYVDENGKSIPVFITDFPIEICPLARKSDNSTCKSFNSQIIETCDRFELYMGGMEIANGYQELNDPKEQRKRFEEQLKSNQKDPMDLDEDYIEALSYGMPPTVGAGIGICRLVQILTNASSIKDVILFPTV